MNSQCFDVGLCEVSVEFPEVVDCEHDAHDIDEDPDGIEDIVSVGTL